MDIFINSILIKVSKWLQNVSKWLQNGYKTFPNGYKMVTYDNVDGKLLKNIF